MLSCCYLPEASPAGDDQAGRLAHKQLTLTNTLLMAGEGQGMTGRKGLLWGAAWGFCNHTLKGRTDNRQGVRQGLGLNMGKEGWSRVSGASGNRDSGAEVG